jgi:CrcB protein
MSVGVWILVGALGGVGALLRFRLDEFIQGRVGGGFPLGTLTVNAVGAFTLGLLTGLSVTGDTLLLAGTALLGSFTTFSTWMFESQRLAEDGEGRLAFANIAVSLLVGLMVAAAGWAIGAAA